MFPRLVIPLLLVMLTASPAAAEEIVIGSGTSIANDILRPVQAPFEKATGHALVIRESAEDAALKGLAEGEFHAAAVSLPVKESREAIWKLGLPEIPLEGSVLASRRMLVILTTTNPIKSLTKEQIRGLMTGTIESWDEVGGPDIPVQIFLARITPGINKSYYETFLENAQIPAEVTVKRTGAEVRSEVSITPEGIGLVDASLADESVWVPEQPVASSSAYLYTKGAPSPAVKQLVKFIRGSGRAHIRNR